MVPRSFSRTTDSAVDTTAVIIEMYAISPGTRNSVLRSCGLYQMRGSTLTRGPRTRRSATAPTEDTEAAALYSLIKDRA
jgi:hypothetical protein